MSTEKKMTIDERLGLNKYEFDEQSHIKIINDELCKTCKLKPCLVVCPAEVYKLVDDKISVNHENCVECSTCTIACSIRGNGAIDWNLPRGGFGILYRYG